MASLMEGRLSGLAQIGVDVAQSGFDVKKLNTYDVGQCATAPDDRL
jgi:hypothetical protein